MGWKARRFDVGARRTKILVTVGPAIDSRDRLRTMAARGADGFRLNFSHGTGTYHHRVLRELHRIRRESAREFAIVADLSGPKIRLGVLAQPTVRLVEGQPWDLDLTGVPGDDRRAPVEYSHLMQAANPGDPVLVGDGSVELQVLSVGRRELTTRVTHGGFVSSHLGLHLPRARLRESILGRKDLDDLSLALREGVDFVALSFVRSGSDVVSARRRIAGRNRDGPPGIIAKIERAVALEAIDGILDEADGIMVARGDLGIEVPLERLALEQKRLIGRANGRGRFVIVATQLLLSMVQSARPTRAEATDVANAVLDGADGLMLSEESAIGRFPVESLGWLDRIARATEASVHGRPAAPVRDPEEPVERAVARSAVEVASAVGAVAIVTPTRTGGTARAVARLRPATPVLALSSEPRIRRQLSLVWGVDCASTPPHLTLEGLRDRAVGLLRRTMRVAPASRLVVTAGYPVEGVPTNLLNVVEVRSRAGPPRGRRRSRARAPTRSG